jgi:hypothetical protein
VETTEQRYKRYLENPDQLDAEIRTAVAIDLDDALLDMQRQAQTYVEWASLASLADGQSEALKQHFEQLSAECRERAYEKLTLANEKATDQRIKDVALRDPAIIKHAAIRKQVDYFAARLKHVQTALLHKKDMLIQIAYRQRAEFGFYQKDTETRSYRDIELDELKERAREAHQR